MELPENFQVSSGFGVEKLDLSRLSLFIMWEFPKIRGNLLGSLQ